MLQMLEGIPFQARQLVSGEVEKNYGVSFRVGKTAADELHVAGEVAVQLFQAIHGQIQTLEAVEMRQRQDGAYVSAPQWNVSNDKSFKTGIKVNLGV